MASIIGTEGKGNLINVEGVFLIYFDGLLNGGKLKLTLKFRFFDACESSLSFSETILTFLGKLILQKGSISN